MKYFFNKFYSTKFIVMQRAVLILFVGLFLCGVIKAQDYEIKYDTLNASGWFGGDNRTCCGPRDIGIGQSVLVDSTITLNNFSFYFTTRFDFAQNPDGFGHQVTLVLNIRDNSGTILQTEQAIVPDTFEGGWVTWSNIDMNVSANTSIIFTTYQVGAYDTAQYFNANGADADAGYTNGVRYTKGDTSDANMEIWEGWNVHSWDAMFWLQGTLMIIPVELTSFTAVYNNGQVILNWSTATETNNQGFEVQRKTGEGVYENIGFVSGYGTTTKIQNYSYIDSEIPRDNYAYRLKQIDFDGSFEYSSEVVVDLTIPLEFALAQNYPNPFNPTTQIKYSSPEESFVQLRVYDILGNVVASLVNERVKAGEHEVSFNASKLSSGIYFYQLISKSKFLTKSMVLLK